MKTVLSRSTCRRAPAAFTLTELLIVMGVIAALSVLTLVSMRAIVKDARLASATNTITASLENARALAMKKNNIVLLVFRARLDGDDGVVVDIVPCEWTGESYRNGIGVSAVRVIDRFMPIPTAPVRTLPRGIKVAAPFYARGDDAVWATQSHLPATAAFNEVAGVIFGVMYGPDGVTLSNNAHSDSDLLWVDFNFDPTALNGPFILNGGTNFLPHGFPSPPEPNADLSDPTFYEQNFNDDEPFVVIAPFLAVYDDDEARELGRVDQWNTLLFYQEDLVGVPNDPNPTIPSYITANAKRIHFNRYTGVVMK